MPFIRGRYYMNPAVGEAIEAAREAEAAQLAREQEARRNDDGSGDDESQGTGPSKGPVQRVEIETAGVVPAHSGRAERGYVARIHRSSADDGGDGTDFWGQPTARGRGAGEGRPETHVFAGHRDLLTFLRDELSKDAGNSR